ncbi:MAG: YggT family protein [Acidiferrobacterales bacterium]
MNGFFAQAGAFLISTLFGMYILAVLLRFLLQVVRGDFYNPLAQFFVIVTNPLLLPLRRIIPGLGGVDVASLVLLAALEIAEQYLVARLHGFNITLLVLIVLSVSQLAELTLYIFLFTIVVRVILSWIAPYPRNPAMNLLVSLSEPLLRPARRTIPPIGGLDLSPIAVLILLQLAVMLVDHLTASFAQLAL